MEPFVLKDKDRFPTSEVLSAVLKNSFPAYEQLEKELAEAGTGIEWKYYNDGKTWMGKLMAKKKNLGWLHVYSGFFTVTCFCMEKHLETIAASALPQQIKDQVLEEAFESKLKPMRLEVRAVEQLTDAHKLLDFKKRLK